MARVLFLDIPEGQEHKYKKVLKAARRFVRSAIRMKSAFLSRSMKQRLLEQSNLLIAKAKWQELDQTTRDMWKIAGEINNLTGWQLFIADISERRKRNLSVPGTPNGVYQVRVGKITIPTGATFAGIKQEHPENYIVKTKEPNTKTMFNPVNITEDFSLPLEIGICYKTDLTSAGSNPEAYFSAKIISHYQGTEIETEFKIEMPLSSAWTADTLTIETVQGNPKTYELFIKINDSVGSVYFDNVNCEHNGQNWARDKRCDNIAETFSAPFQDVIHNWKADGLDTGATFESIYYDV